MSDDIPHTNPAYTREMNKMAELIERMEETLSAQFDGICKAFVKMDPQEFKAIRRNDLELNAIEGKALGQAISVLACYQPVAEDLRTVVGALYAAAEYERMGDYIKNLARSTGQLAKNSEDLKVFPSLNDMAEKVNSQFRDYLAVSRGDDLDKAIGIWKSDEAIDEQFREVVNEAVENQGDGDGDGQSLIHAVTVANNLERMGDRIKNLIELFYYRKTGERLLDRMESD